MQLAPVSADEPARLLAVHRLALLDTKPEERFDSITREAVEKLKVPMSTISILDEKREWFKSCQDSETKEGERAVSFCGHALLATDMFIIPDTLKDARFADNPMVVGAPFVRFYAGRALFDYVSGQAVAVFCVKDIKPRSLSVGELDIFMDLANRAEVELNKK